MATKLFFVSLLLPLQFEGNVVIDTLSLTLSHQQRPWEGLHSPETTE